MRTGLKASRLHNRVSPSRSGKKSVPPPRTSLEFKPHMSKELESPVAASSMGLRFAVCGKSSFVLPRERRWLG